MKKDGAASRGSLVALEGTVFDGRFRVEDRIAEGGFAVVFKARQIALDRRVALKVLKVPRHQDEIGRAEFCEKFAIEAKTIARLRHPHIVDVYDFSVATLSSGELAPWMALEWLEGETLTSHLGRRRSAGQRGLGPCHAVDFLAPVMQALAHAHKHGIVHRDIKPSNIMVTETARGPSLRVLDFGIAKIMVGDQSPDTGNTRTEGAPAFSPAYAAPEQVSFSRTGPWTDVHALGLILTEVMTDEPPFSDPDPEAHLFEQVMARIRPTPASKGRDVGPFEPLLAKALALSPRDRWRNAGELLAALEEVKAGVSVFPAVAAPMVNGTTGDERDLGGAAAPGSRGVRQAGLFGALSFGALVSVVAVAWALHAKGTRSAPSEGRPVAAAAAGTSGPRPSTPVVEPRTTANSRPPSPSVVNLKVHRDLVVGTAKPLRQGHASGDPKEKRRLPAVPVSPSGPVNAGDGRDLFNDTK